MGSSFISRHPRATTLAAAAFTAAVIAATGITAASRPANATGSRTANGTKFSTKGRASVSSAPTSRNWLTRLPLAFEQNQGQTDERVKFLSRGPGYSVFLTEDAQMVLALRKPTARTVAATGRKALAPPAVISATPVTGDVLRMRLVGASGKPAHISGEKRLPSVVNYFRGSDADKWHKNVATFGSVLYQGVYPGVDLVYYGSDQRRLEYDFRVAPGVDPGKIRLQFQGAERLTVDAVGDLRISLPGEPGKPGSGGSVVEHAPVVYQVADDGHRIPVQARYRLTPGTASAREVQFALGSYDRSRTLVIDPSLSYSTYLGTSGFDYAQAIAVDSSGNAYIVGSPGSSAFPTTTGAYQTSTNDVFVTKLASDGSSLVYSTFIGGSNTDIERAIAVDSSGCAYITGYTTSTDYPTTSGAYQTSNSGSYDAFVTKLAADGSSLVYSTYVGGSSREDAYGIAVDSSGNAYIAGTTQSTNFPATSGAYQTSHGGGFAANDAFVTKLSSNGTSLSYSTYLGGTSIEIVYAIAVNSSGNAYVTGFTGGDFPTTSGAYLTSPSAPGSSNVFVTELSTGGSSLVYSTYVGGSSQTVGYGIAVDSSGNAYVTGQTYSTDFPATTGAYQTSAGGGSFDAFVFSLASGGSTLNYATYLGGNGWDQGNAISVDSSGNAYVTGFTYSTNFPTTSGAYQTTIGSSKSAFFTKLSSSGASLSYSTYLRGNSGASEGYGIAVDSSGDPYICGYTGSNTFPTTTGAYQTSSGGADDGFITKFSM